jgi:hypothetical protein
MANINVSIEADIDVEIDDFLCECSEKEIEEIIEWLKRMDKI